MSSPSPLFLPNTLIWPSLPLSFGAYTPIYEALLAQDDIYLLQNGAPLDPGDNESLPGMNVEAAH